MVMLIFYEKYSVELIFLYKGFASGCRTILIISGISFSKLENSPSDKLSNIDRDISSYKCNGCSYHAIPTHHKNSKKYKNTYS